MDKQSDKPSAEAKALSLFLMAYKTTDPVYKEKLKRINRLWDLSKNGDLDKADYEKEVLNMLDAFGGYSIVIEKTVKYYIDKTGKWKLTGEDKYAQDALKAVKKIQKKA
jgi:hypothetical protein